MRPELGQGGRVRPELDEVVGLGQIWARWSSEARSGRGGRVRPDLGEEVGFGQNWARWSGWAKNLGRSGRGNRG